MGKGIDTLKCPTCHKEYLGIPDAPFCLSQVCSSCKESNLEKEKDNFFAALRALPIEQRVEELEYLVFALYKTLNIRTNK